MLPCPECETYSVHPHCNDPECEGLVCYRAGCTYKTDGCSRPEGLVAGPSVERLDRAPGVQMTRYKRVLRIGTFSSTMWSENKVANGWVMDPQDRAQPWPTEELREMWEQFEEIASLPEYEGARND